MEDLPKPNTQALSWFYGEHKKKTLDLEPKYQRNPIWSPGQKCFLIDSIISGCPIPQVYLNVKTTGQGPNKKTTYEVVDGQQRLRTILEFMNDEWPLLKTAATSYPVSGEYKKFLNLKYSKLPDAIQDRIWNFPLAVQELRSWTDAQIRALFRRLNYVVERLNKQELRHSQYFGEYISAVEKLANEQFWDDVDMFTRKAAQRMKDVEFVSELFAIVVEGLQDGQETLDAIYAKYDVQFPGRSKFEERFKRVLSSLNSISAYLSESRFVQKADFYSLFAATNSVMENKPIDLSNALKGLKALEKRLEMDVEEMDEATSLYHSTIIEGPNKLAKRKTRTSILQKILEKA